MTDSNIPFDKLESTDIADVFAKAYAYRDARAAVMALPLPGLDSDHAETYRLAAAADTAQRELIDAAAALPAKADTHPEREQIVRRLQLLQEDTASRLQSLQEEAQEADDDGRC